MPNIFEHALSVVYNWQLRAVNISKCYFKFNRTNQSCSDSKLSQSINMKLISTLFMKVRKLWSFEKAT